MNRSLRLGHAVAACAVTTGLFAAVPGAAQTDSKATATASRQCAIGDRQSYTPASYVNSLYARNASCRKARRVTRAFHRCRRNNGGRNGRCPNRVQRYNCSETRGDAVPGVQYNSRVVCRLGARKITSTYTQNV